MTGFSLTHTENYAGFNSMYTTGGQPDTDCVVYFNYYNNFVYSNLVNVANIIYSTGNSTYNNLNNLSSSAINHIPAIRIPLNADYWLSGSGNGSTIYSNMSVNMTSTQYQNMITSMVYYLMNPTISVGCNALFNGTANGCVIILDLHWNYSTSSNNQESGSYIDGTTPPEQCAMAVSTNSILFWTSICNTFGIDSSGNELNTTNCTINTINSSSIGGGTTYTLTSSQKQNIFFELYNEPYVDQINTIPSGSSTYTSYSDYANMFAMYIQGSASTTGFLQDPNNVNTDITYNVVGMGTLYNNIRITNSCNNIIVVGGAESYSYFAGYNYISYGYTTSGGTTIPNNFVSNGTTCYNCWTTLNAAVVGGTIPILDSNGDLELDSSGNQIFYPSNSSGLLGVLANLHPYSDGYCKFPGYMYNTSNDTVTTTPNNGDENPNLCNFLQALQSGTNPIYSSYATTTPYTCTSLNCSDFQITFPIICTEFGMYNLPWINSSGTTYTTMYNQTSPPTVSQGTSSDWEGTQTAAPTYYYGGQYYDEYGNATTAPFIIGYFENFQTFNISYTIWGLFQNTNAFDQTSSTQINYSPTPNTTTLPLLTNSDINTITTGQNAFDMTFCFYNYYLGLTGTYGNTIYGGTGSS